MAHMTLPALKSVPVKVKTSETTHVKLSLELYHKVREIAVAEGRTIANTIRRLLSEAIERRDGR